MAMAGRPGHLWVIPSVRSPARVRVRNTSPHLNARCWPEGVCKIRLIMTICIEDHVVRMSNY